MSAEFPESKRLLGALANSRVNRHEENAARLVTAALEMPREVGAALLASAEGYTPRSTQLIEAARERLGTIQEIAGALADDLPAPKTGPSRTRRRRRKKPAGEAAGSANGDRKQGETEASGGAKRPKRRRRRMPAAAAPSPASEAPQDGPAPAGD